MKNILLAFFVALAMVLFFRSTTQTPDNKPVRNSEKMIIATSIYPLYYMTREIVGDTADVRNIVPPGIEPHDYELTPQDAAFIENADILIINGGVEPWFNGINETLTRKGVVVIDTGGGLISYETGDPHIWLDPLLAREQAERIFLAMRGEVSPNSENGITYEQNWRKLEAKLMSIDNAYRNGLSNCEKKSFVTSHNAFQYLADRYGLQQISIAGLTPDKEPTSKELVEMSKFVKDNNIKYIFFESLVSPRLSETIASETGAQTLILDPIEGISNDDASRGVDYGTIMMSNLSHLQTALECAK